MREAIRATRRDLIEAATQSIKHLVTASQACHNNALVVSSLIAEDDQNHFTEEELESMQGAVGTMLDVLASVNAETLTAITALVTIDRCNTFLTGNEPENVSAISP